MQESKQSKLSTTLFVAVFMVSVLLCYANTFNAPFLFDDYNFIVKNNPEIQIDELSIDTLKETAASPAGRKRPLATISLAVNYYFSGTDTTDYHLVNTAIHLLGGIFLFFLFRITLGLAENQRGKNAHSGSVSHQKTHSWIAFLAVLIWLVHPLQTNAVTYIVQRMTSMAAMFFILSMLCYAKGRIQMRTGKSAVRVGLFMGGFVIFGLCAVASKENAATLPLFILLYEWFFFQDLKSVQTRYVIIGSMAAIFVFIALCFLFLGSNPVHSIMRGYGLWDFTLPQRLLTEFRVVAYYLTLIFFPHPGRLTIDYNYPLSFSLTDPPTTILSIAMVGVLLFLAVYSARKHRLFSFCILWFLGNLVIESTIIPIEIIYEHRLYLPSMMICLFVVYLAWQVFSSPKTLTVGVLAIAAILGLWTHQRNQVWSSDIVFWEDAARKAPNYARPLQNLAWSLQHKGHHEKAVHYYEKSLEIKKKPAAFYNMGLSYSKMGWHLEAINAFRNAIDSNYRNSHVYEGLAYELTLIGEFEAAIKNYKKALEINPDNQAAKSRFQELIRFLKQCRNPEACVNALSEQNPENPALWFKKGFIQERRRNIKEAIAAYEKVLSLMPESSRQLYLLTLNHLATCRLMGGKTDEAMALFGKGAILAPEDYKFSYQLAALHAYQGNMEEAIKWLETAVENGFSDIDRLESDTRLRKIREMPFYQDLKNRISN